MLYYVFKIKINKLKIVVVTKKKKYIFNVVSKTLNSKS